MKAVHRVSLMGGAAFDTSLAKMLTAAADTVAAVLREKNLPDTQRKLVVRQAERGTAQGVSGLEAIAERSLMAFDQIEVVRGLVKTGKHDAACVQCIALGILMSEFKAVSGGKAKSQKEADAKEFCMGKLNSTGKFPRCKEVEQHLISKGHKATGDDKNVLTGSVLSRWKKQWALRPSKRKI